MAITSAAAMTGNTASAITTLSVTNTAVNDVWVVYVCTRSASITATGMSSTKAGTWINATGNWLDGTGAANESIWIGTMTGTGADTITVTFSGSVTGVTNTIDAHPFHSSLGSPQWTVDRTGAWNTSSSTTVTFPQLTPSVGTELYWGHARVPGTANTPAPAGFVFNNDSNGDPEMYNVAVSSVVNPTLQQSPSGNAEAIAFLLSETASAVSGTLSPAAHPATANLNGIVPYIGSLATGNTAPAMFSASGGITVAGSMGVQPASPAVFLGSGMAVQPGASQPLAKASNTQQGTGTACTFTLAQAPSVGDLMVAVLVVDTPTTVKAPSIFTTNISDNWVPVFATNDTQEIPDTRGLRMHVFYKTANATDATQTTFTFQLPAMVDASQGGLPQYPTTDYAGILATYISSGLGYCGFDLGSPQQMQPNGNQSTFQLPLVNTNGASDTFLSVIATLGQPTVAHTDPSASLSQSVSNTAPAYLSQAFTVALWASTATGTKYPFAFLTNGANPYGDVITATLGLRTSQNFYYLTPFARMGYPYEGADMRLITRYPTHWSFTVLIQGNSPLIGQSFSQDQLAAASRYYMGQMLCNPSSDFNLILNSGVGGDFRPQ